MAVQLYSDKSQFVWGSARCILDLLRLSSYDHILTEHYTTDEQLRNFRDLQGLLFGYSHVWTIHATGYCFGHFGHFFTSDTSSTLDTSSIFGLISLLGFTFWRPTRPRQQNIVTVLGVKTFVQSLFHVNENIIL